MLDPWWHWGLALVLPELTSFSPVPAAIRRRVGEACCSLAIWEYILVIQYETVRDCPLTAFHEAGSGKRTNFFDWLATSYLPPGKFGYAITIEGFDPGSE